MDADFSIELGRDDPVLDFPWKDPAGKLAYVDLKRHPELMVEIEEAEKFPELGEFLRVDRKSTRLNSSHTVISYAVFCLKKKKMNTAVCEMLPIEYVHVNVEVRT